MNSGAGETIFINRDTFSSSMDLESRVQDLKDEIELMRICYQKGFGCVPQIIAVKCEGYMNQPDNPHWKNSAMEVLERVEAHYRNIPFERIIANPNFSALFVCRDLLEKYGQFVREFFSTPQEETYDRIKQLGCAISEVGRVFQAKVNGKIDELRQIPGFEKYNVRVVDHQGNEFGIY